MTAFEAAFSLLKAPWLHRDHMGSPLHSFKDGRMEEATVSGPLYSGGDIMDEPQYWTDDFNEALSYALFGSAIPRGGDKSEYQEMFLDNIGGMRQTRPMIFVAEDPGDPMADPDWPHEVFSDPASEAYTAPQGDNLDFKPLGEEKMAEIIRNLITDQDDMFTWGNTGTYFGTDERRQHIKEALDRLLTNTPGNLWIPDAALPFSETSATDDADYRELDLDEEELRELGRWDE